MKAELKLTMDLAWTTYCKVKPGTEAATAAYAVYSALLSLWAKA